MGHIIDNYYKRSIDFSDSKLLPQPYNAGMGIIRDRMLQRMEAMGHDQSSLARAIGTSQGTIFQILDGRIRKSKYLPDIARELGTTVDYLEGRSHDPSPNASALPKDDVFEAIVRGVLEQHAPGDWSPELIKGMSEAVRNTIELLAKQPGGATDPNQAHAIATGIAHQLARRGNSPGKS